MQSALSKVVLQGLQSSGREGSCCSQGRAPRWLSQELCPLHGGPGDSDMLSIKPHGFGVILKGLSVLLGAYSHDYFEPESLKGCLDRGAWQRTSVWAQSRAAISMYLGLFTKVAHIRAGRKATKSGRLRAQSLCGVKKRPAYFFICFL